MRAQLAAVAQEQQVLLVAAMQRIPVDFQITLELSYWEHLSGPEIAEVLGISSTTVRTRLLRASLGAADNEHEFYVALSVPTRRWRLSSPIRRPAPSRSAAVGRPHRSW